MTIFRAMTFLILCSLGTALSAERGDAISIRSLRYTMEGNTGRLTIGTDGVPAVVMGHHGEVVVLGFRHAIVSSPPGAAHLLFTEGPMRSAVIERVGTDSITVTVHLRVRGSLDVGLEGHSVVLRASPLQKRNGLLKEASVQPKAGSGPLNFSMVSGEGSSSKGRSPDRIAFQQNGPQETSLGLGTILMLFAVVVFSGVSSIAIALVIVRRQQTDTTTSRPLQHGHVDESQELPIEDAHWEESMDERLTPILEDEEESEDEIEARGYQMAKALRRGKGEMDLARRMEGNHDDAFGEKVNKSCHTAKTKAQRVRNAKKLGVGRGEIDLALRLRTMVPVKTSEEEA